MKLLCRFGVHRWVGTIFLGAERGRVGEQCRWCRRARIEKLDGWHYYEDGEVVL